MLGILAVIVAMIGLMTHPSRSVAEPLTIKLLCTGSSLLRILPIKGPVQDKITDPFKEVVDIDMSNRTIHFHQVVYLDAKITDDIIIGEIKTPNENFFAHQIRINRLTGEFFHDSSLARNDVIFNEIQKGSCEPAPKQLF
jgi:hypothetical protein